MIKRRANFICDYWRSQTHERRNPGLLPIGPLRPRDSTGDPLEGGQCGGVGHPVASGVREGDRKPNQAAENAFRRFVTFGPDGRQFEKAMLAAIALGVTSPKLRRSADAVSGAARRPVTPRMETAKDGRIDAATKGPPPTDTKARSSWSATLTSGASGLTRRVVQHVGMDGIGLMRRRKRYATVMVDLTEAESPNVVPGARGRYTPATLEYPGTLTPKQREAPDHLFVELPAWKNPYEARVPVKEIFDAATDRATAEHQLGELRAPTEALRQAVGRFWTTSEYGKTGILNSLEERYTSAAVAGINNKACLMTKYCNALKSPGTLWNWLLLKRTANAGQRTIAALRERVSGLEAVFLAFCS